MSGIDDFLDWLELSLMAMQIDEPLFTLADDAEVNAAVDVINAAISSKKQAKPYLIGDAGHPADYPFTRRRGFLPALISFNLMHTTVSHVMSKALPSGSSSWCFIRL